MISWYCRSTLDLPWYTRENSRVRVCKLPAGFVRRRLSARQARIPAGAGAGKAFRPGGGKLRRHPADAVGRHQAARGDARRPAGQARLALPGLHAGGRARARLGAAHRRRRPRDAPGHQRAEARPDRPAAHRRRSRRRCRWSRTLTTPYRATPSRTCSSPSCRAPRSRSSTCWTISRSTPASPISTTSRSAASTRVPLYHEHYRLLTSADAPLGDRDNVTWARGRAGAALPADARHAEPAHHRRAAAERRRRFAADAGIQFDDPAVLPCAHRPLGERDAGEARRDARASPTRSAPSRSSSRKPCTPIGLVVPPREPMTPLNAALVAEARRIAASLG